MHLKIIQRLQLENQSLKNNNWMLGEKNKVLASNQHRRSSAQVPDELKAFNIELSTFTHKYGVIAKMFPPEHHILRLLVPNLSPGVFASTGSPPSFHTDLSFSIIGTLSTISKVDAPARSATMSTVFGNWEPLAKAIRIMMFRKNLLDIPGWPCAKCNARKWGTMSCTPGLLAWGWVTLIFILSSNTSFTKAGVGAKSRLPYAAMFTAYKQLWVTLWCQPHICTIRKKIDAYVWQSSSTSNIATSNAEGEDFTSDLMCLAIANAGHKESDDFPGPPTTDNNSVNDIPGPVTPTTPMIAPSAPAIVPSAPGLAIVPSAPAIVALAPANATTAPNPATPLPAIPAPGPPVASEPAGAAAATAASEDSGPSAMAVDLEVPGVPDDVPVVVSAPSSGRWGRERKAGMLAPISSGPASEQAAGQPKRTRKK
ncbi:uncharacterized protein EDB91DRAFT_1245475 [Suillus paluster]|uniref:uncharacterized protein n=1 Tax=Suillus paluster TaxID=48578 RepID=UPI001B8869CB|nr:uncharacterized protein EDB91DRAFT_1245475 [Suillus paluster]KAG1747036.1 hypothetical protein EDB91DRAFT_1245475 [Suillus paluster]